MAASSTDAYSNSNGSEPIGGNNLPLFKNYPVVSVTTGPNHFWPVDAAPSSSTSPSSDHNWEVDEEEATKRKIYELKRQFHNGRFLIVRHLPRDATEEDIRSLLSGHLVHSVQMNSVNGSARVLLAEPEVLETWGTTGKTSQHLVKGQKVTITPSNTEGLLCVARLPIEFTEEEFAGLVASFGDVNYSFLMRSEKTGDSKDYGFVEYLTKEMALHAKASLDGRTLHDAALVCEWLEPSHVTFAALHATTLYVDRIPKDYRQMGDFRKLFSQVANPPYCQIAMMNGALQTWGLVEFTSPEEAEETRTLLQGHKLQGQPIRIAFYIPGVRAINIYMKLLNDPGQKTRGALLPEPPANKVFTQLQNLTKHNPAFAKSLQNIILTQIESLQQKTIPSPPLGASIHGPILKGGRILGPPPPSMHLQLPPYPPPQHPPPQQIHNIHQPPPLPTIPPPSQPPPLHPPIDKSLNSNAQAALIILLAAQLQQQQEQHQNGVPAGGPSSNSSTQLGSSISSIAANNILSNPHILNLLQTLVSQGDPQHPQDPKLSPQLPQTPPRNGYHPSNGHSNGHNANNILSSNLKDSFRNGYFKNGATKLTKNALLPTPPFEENSAPTDDPERGVTPLLNDLLSGVKETPKGELKPSLSTLLSNAQSLQHLLGSLNPDVLPSVPPAPLHPPISMPPPPTIIPHPSMYHPHPPGHGPTDPVMSLLLRAADPRPPPPERFLSPVEAGAPFFLAAPRPPPPVVSASWTPTHETPPQIFHQPVFGPQPRLYSPIYLAPQHQLIGAPFSFDGFSTPPPPVGQKRKSNQFLPSPEPSPENGYIGQHSQGIGGHYQDSYMVKKQKKH